MAHGQPQLIASYGIQPVMAHGQSWQMTSQSWHTASRGTLSVMACSQLWHMASQSWHAAMMYLASHGKGPASQGTWLASHGKGPASHTIKLKQVLKPHEQTPFFLGHDEYAPAKHPSRQPDTL